jgi:hypothetical protein
MSTSGKAPIERDRCEVCSRVISQRPNPRKRRCGDHLEVAPLFPVSACKKPKRANGSMRAKGGER